MLWTEVTDPWSTDQVNAESRLHSVCKELWARRHPPGRAPDREAATTETCWLPTEACCQETSRSSPGFIYCTPHQGHSRCLCGWKSSETRGWEKERYGDKKQRVGERLSDIVNLHLGLKTICQHHSLPTMPPWFIISQLSAAALRLVHIHFCQTKTQFTVQFNLNLLDWKYVCWEDYLSYHHNFKTFVSFSLLLQSFVLLLPN